MRLLKPLFASVILAATLLVSIASAQQSPQVTSGLNWLQSKVGADGGVAGEGASIATVHQVRAETYLTLKQLGSPSAAEVDAVAAEPDANNEYISRKIIALAQAGRDTTTLAAQLLATQNSDGGFGGALGYASNPLDTSWAVLALKAAGGSNSASISAAVTYLLSAQDASGGFSPTGSSLDATVSALAAIALQSSTSNPSVQGALTNVTAWLLSQQLADGSWGSVAETSSVYIALVTSTSDPGLRNLVAIFLNSKQAADGSWEGDPYITALALRALTAQPTQLPTTGSVVLHVIDSFDGQPLAGVTATFILPGGGGALQTDANGKVGIASATPGNYSVSISASGYITQSANFIVTAGTTIDLGTIALPIASTTGVLKGVVTDAVGGQPLSGVTITAMTSAGAASVITASDGSYRLNALAPGSVSLNANKAGYVTVSGNATIVGGAILTFAPIMPVTGQTPIGTPATVVGQVVDAVTQAPLSGVLVKVVQTGDTGTTGGDGRFNITGINPGAYDLSFTLAGYSTRTISVALPVAGLGGVVSDVRVVSLNKDTGVVSVAGTVSDVSSGQAIPGATVTVLGTGLRATADSNGKYRLDGLLPGTSTLRFSATGYASEAVIRVFGTAGVYRADQSLLAATTSGISILSLTSDLLHYSAYAPATIQVSVFNNGVQPQSGTVGVIVRKPDGTVLETLQATRVDANGLVQSGFTFPLGVTTISVPWNTKANAPGGYTVIARVYAGTVLPGGLVEVASKQTAFTIDPTQSLLSATLTPLPAFTYLGANAQLGFRLDLVNRSNVAISSQFAYQLSAPNAAVVHVGTTSVQLQPTEGTKSILISGPSYTFPASGIYSSTLSSQSGVVPTNLVGKTISVAPGTRIDSSQSVAPTIVTPDGDKRIRMNIRMQGVQQQ